MKVTIALLSIAFLVGCASDPTRMTINTQPAGGYITEIGSGSAFGIAPVSVQYVKSNLKVRDQTGCAIVRGFRAQWVSGATSSTTESVRLCKNLDDYAITIDRDPSTPGFEKDMDFALKIATANAQQRQAAAAEAAAAFQFSGVMQQSAPVSCTSMPIGKMVQTNCR